MTKNDLNSLLTALLLFSTLLVMTFGVNTIIEKYSIGNPKTIGLTEIASMATIVATFIATVTLLIAIVGLWLIARQVKAAAELNKITQDEARENRQFDIQREKELRAVEFYKTYTDPLHMEHFSKARNYLRVTDHNDEEQKWNNLKIESQSATELRVNISIMLNFFLGMAMMYNRNLVDRSIIKILFRVVSPTYYNEAEWYIKRLEQKYKDEVLIKEWREMNNNLINMG